MSSPREAFDHAASLIRDITDPVAAATSEHYPPSLERSTT